MVRFEDQHFYAVTTRHGGYNSFHSLAEARDCANQIMIGYLEGTTCNNDPHPTIIKIEEIEQLGLNPITKVTYKRSGGPNFGGYRDHNCYTGETDA